MEQATNPSTQPDTATRLTFASKQKVDLYQWVAEDRPVIHETYDRASLLLIAFTYPQGRWRREIAEYELERFESLREKPVVQRDDLYDVHQKMHARRQIPFGLEGPLLLDSDARNTDPRLPVFVPGEKPVPVPHNLLYVPTVMPSLPPPRPQLGVPYAGKIQLLCRGGSFGISYSAVMKAPGKIDATFDGQGATAASELVKLTLTINGTQSFSMSTRDASPLESSGEISFKLHAEYRNMAMKPMSVDWLRGTYKYTFTRIPVGWDEKKVSPSAWNFDNPRVIAP